MMALTRLHGSHVVCVAVVKVIRGSLSTGLGCSSAVLQASMLPRKRCSSSWHLRSSMVQLLACCCCCDCCSDPALLPPLVLVEGGVGVRSADSSTSRFMANVALKAAHDKLLGDRAVATAACSYASVSSCIRCSDEFEPTEPGLIAPAASWNIKRACMEEKYVTVRFIRASGRGQPSGLWSAAACTPLLLLPASCAHQVSPRQAVFWVLLNKL